MNELTVSLIFLGFSIPAFAATPVQVPWNQICNKSADSELVIQTSTGEAVQGYCLRVDVTEVSISEKGKVVKIAKDKIAKMLMIPKRHPLRSLGHGMAAGFKYGSEALLSPAAPLGIVSIPATVAWGAIAAPFCLIGELKAKLTPIREITFK